MYLSHWAVAIGWQSWVLQPLALGCRDGLQCRNRVFPIRGPNGLLRPLAQKTWTGSQGRVAEGRGWTRCSWAEWFEIAQGQCHEWTKAMILLGKCPFFELKARSFRLQSHSGEGSGQFLADSMQSLRTAALPT